MILKFVKFNCSLMSRSREQHHKCRISSVSSTTFLLPYVLLQSGSCCLQGHPSNPCAWTSFLFSTSSPCMHTGLPLFCVLETCVLLHAPFSCSYTKSFSDTVLSRGLPQLLPPVYKHCFAPLCAIASNL